jgi:hypothetical protein
MLVNQAHSPKQQEPRNNGFDRVSIFRNLGAGSSRLLFRKGPGRVKVLFHPLLLDPGFP